MSISGSSSDCDAVISVEKQQITRIEAATNPWSSVLESINIYALSKPVKFTSLHYLRHTDMGHEDRSQSN